MRIKNAVYYEISGGALKGENNGSRRPRTSRRRSGASASIIFPHCLYQLNQSYGGLSVEEGSVSGGEGSEWWRRQYEEEEEVSGGGDSQRSRRL
jgi:hypothetical protein